MINKIRGLFLSLVIAGLAASAPAQQAAANGGGGNGGGVGDRLFPMIGRVLTSEQRQSLQQLMESQRTQIRPLVEKLQASRQAMLNQVASGNFDESLVRQYAAQSASAEAELTVMYARALSQMQPRLSAQQIAQIKNFQPGRYKAGRNGDAGDESTAAPEVHLKLPPPLPRDTNDLPMVN
jgi:Spy/CpxP family protein refolding chaperone